MVYLNTPVIMAPSSVFFFANFMLLPSNPCAYLVLTMALFINTCAPLNTSEGKKRGTMAVILLLLQELLP